MKRIITAVIVLPFLIASILISWLQPLFVLLIAAALLLGLLEFRKLARRRGLKPVDEAMFLGAAGLFCVFYFNESAQELLTLQLIVAILILLTIGTLTMATLRGAPFDAIISSSGATILGVLYVVFLGGHLIALRTGFSQPLAAHLLSFLFLVVMGSDAGAYYVGRAFGKHKLAPQISPGKTWEGLAGGLLAGVLLAAVSHFWFFKNLPLSGRCPWAG
jgi:phosphatidate cytidylyltransferase